jgi:hypothetical protein
MKAREEVVVTLLRNADDIPFATDVIVNGASSWQRVPAPGWDDWRWEVPAIATGDDVKFVTASSRLLLHVESVSPDPDVPGMVTLRGLGEFSGARPQWPCGMFAAGNWATTALLTADARRLAERRAEPIAPACDEDHPDNCFIPPFEFDDDVPAIELVDA